jgi:hypothetical protein
MTALAKGLLVGALQCAVVLTLAAKLHYDRATKPRVWVKTAPFDPNLPIRGRYVSLRLIPAAGDLHFSRTNGQRIAYFIPEHAKDPSIRPAGEELWAEVTIPSSGPPRPIRLGVRRGGELRALE